MRKLLLPAFLVVVHLGCNGTDGPADAGDEREWVGSITSEGNVTTVVNQSGSVWGGPAQLVEEASIGTLEGADEYMLGGVTSIAFDGSRILVGDRQGPTVRIYDADGTYVADLGQAGQGPGEYENPASVVVASDGRYFVRDDAGRKILVYSPAGDYLEMLRLAGGLQTGTPMVLDTNDVPYTIVIAETLDNDPYRLWILGMQAHGADGPYGDPVVPPEVEFERGIIRAEREGSSSWNSVPFWPDERWTMDSRLRVVHGVSDRYRFQVIDPDGSRLVVEHSAPAIAVDSDEAAWYRARATVQMQSVIPTWTWNGPEVPATKPPFASLQATPSGEVWVRRNGPGERITPCNEDAETSGEFFAEPCWREGSSFDVFGEDGRFLGSVEAPAAMSTYPTPWIDGDTFIARIEDTDGTIYVKRYRLVIGSSES